MKGYMKEALMSNKMMALNSLRTTSLSSAEDCRQLLEGHQALLSKLTGAFHSLVSEAGNVPMLRCKMDCEDLDLVSQAHEHVTAAIEALSKLK